MFGNILLIKSDYWNFIFKFDYYMIRDKFNLFVLDIFFEYMFFFQLILGKFIVNLFYDCDFDDLFRILGCVDICFKILDNFEMFVFKVLLDLKGINFLCKRNIFFFYE